MFDNVVTLLIAAAGFVLVLISIFLPRIIRGKTQATTVQPPAPSLASDERTSERIDSDLLRLEETARELFGRLDARARVLIRLIEEAEVRAQELERIIEKGKNRA